MISDIALMLQKLKMIWDGSLRTFETGILKTVNWYFDNRDWINSVRKNNNENSGRFWI